MEQIKRRDFLKKASTALASTSGLLAGCGSQPAGESGAPAVHTRQRYEWRMVTTWAPHFPVMGEGADMIAQWLDEMSEGRLKVQVYGGGELVPALEAFEAVSQGVAEMSHGAAYYWAGKVPAAQFFTAVPFGMNAQQMNAWILSGDGLQLWEEVYAPFNLLPIPAGNTGVQMGGWFNKEINTIEDLKGLKMRIPGLGGKVISQAGGTGLTTPGAEIYTNLERGVIDATEWVGPYHDYLMGFYRIAKYYYYPGWHEPGPVLEMTINRSAFEQLPKDLQAMIRTAGLRANIWMLTEFEAKNSEYLKKIRAEPKVQLVRFPAAVLSAFKKYTDEVIADLVGKDPVARKVFDAFDKFREQIVGWASISEKEYYNLSGV